MHQNECLQDKWPVSKSFCRSIRHQPFFSRWLSLKRTSSKDLMARELCRILGIKYFVPLLIIFTELMIKYKPKVIREESFRVAKMSRDTNPAIFVRFPFHFLEAQDFGFNVALSRNPNLRCRMVSSRNQLLSLKSLLALFKDAIPTLVSNQDPFKLIRMILP